MHESECAALAPEFEGLPNPVPELVLFEEENLEPSDEVVESAS